MNQLLLLLGKFFRAPDANRKQYRQANIRELLATIKLPGVLTEIRDEKPVYYDAAWQDGRWAYFLAAEGTDSARLMEELDECILAAGFTIEYGERLDTHYVRGDERLSVNLDTSPEGFAAGYDLSGKATEGPRWPSVPAGRIVVSIWTS